MTCKIIAITNQKGGVGKTTTSINLSQALALIGEKVLVVDADPQGNTTRGFGVAPTSVKRSISDLILDRDLPASEAIYEGDGISLIPATRRLAEVEREMVGMTNSELRLARKLASVRDSFSVVLIDVPPTFGPLMNSALNAADCLIVPIDSGFFGLTGLQDMLAEIEEIKLGTNPKLQILGLLLTLTDHTRMTGEVCDELIASFGEKVFSTMIRRNVKLKEAPALGKTIFHHAPNSTGASDYLSLAREVESRIHSSPLLVENPANESAPPIAGGAN